MFEVIVIIVFLVFVYKLISKKRPYNVDSPLHLDEYPDEYKKKIMEGK